MEGEYRGPRLVAQQHLVVDGGGLADLGCHLPSS
jgi:hypothetical protein